MKIPANGFTHAGKFHADDVFATALLQIIRPDIRITRGFVVPDDFDGIVYDIGFGMFDHHQEPREYRANGIPYAAFGLLWRGAVAFSPIPRPANGEGGSGGGAGGGEENKRGR